MMSAFIGRIHAFQKIRQEERGDLHNEGGINKGHSIYVHAFNELVNVEWRPSRLVQSIP